MTGEGPGRAKRVTILLRSPRSVKGGVIHLLEELKRLGASQATAFNAMASFTAQSPIRSIQQIEFMPELPVIVLWVDAADIVARVLPQITPLIQSGTVTVDDTQIVLQVSPELADLPKATLVGDVMTRDVFTARVSSPVSELVDGLIRRGLRSVPIVDEDGKVVGIVTNGDLVRRAGLGARIELLVRMEPAERTPHLAGLLDSLTAADIMTSNPVTTVESASVREAARKMLDHHLKRLPVVDNEGRLVGIVSRVNLLRTVAAPGVNEEANGNHPESVSASSPVARIMTKDVPVVREDAPVPLLVNRIISTRLNCAVVVDEKERPVGVVSDADLIARVTPAARPGLVASLVRSLPFWHGSEEEQELARQAHGRTARDFLDDDYVLASRDATIAEVLRQMLDRQKKLAVLVGEDGRVVGMVDRRDLLGALA